MKEAANKMMTVTFLNKKELSFNPIPLLEEAIDASVKGSGSGRRSDEDIINI
jgi:hypothetical protein